MKKASGLIIVSLLCLMALDSRNQFSSVSAQVKNRGDHEMADTVKRLTNRSSDGLVQTFDADGGFSINLEGRFQNLFLGRMDSGGETVSACVASLGEANLFFERNLETGERLPNDVYRPNSLEKLAERHGMSKQEYIFYQDMIANAETGSLIPSASTVTIVNNDGAGEGFNDATAVASEGGNSGTLGQQRLNLFNFAAGIWGGFLDSNVSIQVRSQFDPLTCTPTSAVLGSAGATTVHGNFANHQFFNTYYHQALANKQSGVDQNAAEPDINATFNSNVNGSAGCLGGQRFYLGLNNTTPANTTNLLVVLLHEMGHGLGFSTFANGSTGALIGGLPDVYTTFMFDRTQNMYWNAMTDAQRQASAIDTNDVLWDGSNVKIASGSLTAGRDGLTGRVELFTPNPFQSGSSVSHFSTAAFADLLMEPSINLNLPINLDLSRQQMRDIGWYRDTNADRVADTITTVTPSGGTIIIGTQATATWTNTGGFNRNVIVELSTDGGTNYTLLSSGVSNLSTTGSITFTVPNTPTLNGRIRVREDSFVNPAGVSSSNFTITGPSAATVAVQGRILTPQGRGIGRATIRITGTNGLSRNVLSSSFGYYSFGNLEAGQSYVITVAKKGFAFNSQAVAVNDNLSGVDFTAIP